MGMAGMCQVNQVFTSCSYVLQNYGIRVITSSPPLTSSTQLRTRLPWTTLGDCRELFWLSTVHRCVHRNMLHNTCAQNFRPTLALQLAILAPEVETIYTWRDQINAN